MTCRELTEFLMDYLDNSLPADARSVFERHLGECPECRHYLRSYEATVQLEKHAYRDHDDEQHNAPAELVRAILESRQSQASDRDNPPQSTAD